MNGKMGIAIYFFHLSRETNNQIYEDYAGELVDEIYEEITSYTPVGFENGLAGIGPSGLRLSFNDLLTIYR